MSPFLAFVTVVTILFVRSELWLKKQLSIVLFGFCGYHGMSVYSIQLNEVVCIVNVDRTLNIVTCPVASSSLEITVACDK